MCSADGPRRARARRGRRAHGAEDELDRQVGLADPEVRAVLRRPPPPLDGGGTLGATIRALDRRIREDDRDVTG